MLSRTPHLVLLHHTGSHSPASDAAEASIRKILAKVSQVRQDVVFDVLARKGELPTHASPGELLLSEYGHRDVHGRSSSHGLSTAAHSRDAGKDVSLSCFTVPSPHLLSKRSLPPDGLADLNIGIISLDHTSAALEGNVLTASPDSIEHLTRTAVAIAAWEDPPSQLTIVHNENQLETVTAQCSASLARQSLLGRSRIRHLSLNQAIQALNHAPASLNGVVLAEKSSVEVFAKWASHFEGIHTSCATFSPSSSAAPVFWLDLPNSTSEKSHNAISVVLLVQGFLKSLGLIHEGEALAEALCRALDPPENIGSNLQPVSIGGSTPDSFFVDAISEHLHFFLEAVNSRQLAAVLQPPNAQPRAPQLPRPLNLIQKVIMNASTSLAQPKICTGQYVCAQVEWVLTSELLWGGMEKTYNQIKRPRPYRNDRIWLAIDHTVDPRTKHLPKQKQLMERLDRFRDEAKIISYLPANTSIMHTDFTREKAQPGTIVVGSDSHTCSAGSMGALAIGLGAADVVMPLVTGQTWLRVPEVCRIDFVGKPSYGVTGKDVVLHILGLFKRNTIAFQRAVEYGGTGLRELSMDARFAIANMTTEFGGMGACFEADETTARWLSKRRSRKDRFGARYFRPDPDASYAEVRTIDLSQVEHTIAIYPSPDRVVPLSTKVGMELDGCFIGACTTTEEELIMAALVLDAGLRSNMTPMPIGKRRVTPGSLIIIKRLEALELLEIYRKAGFQIGAPGCSYCVGVNDVDVGQEGEVWLSSQNRNFKNRMGKGSIGNISSAATVAASSFSMRVTDPKHLIDKIDHAVYNSLLQSHTPDPEATRRCARPHSVTIVEPQPNLASSVSDEYHTASMMLINPGHKCHGTGLITGQIQRFGNNVDTDAIIPAEFMPGIDDADLGSHCFQYYRPDFRDKVRAGASIVVAGAGFGSGSSREDAVRALIGVGVEAVVAKSFAFIYERNQLNMGLFRAILVDEAFYALAQEGKIITIDRTRKTITLAECGTAFAYEHSAVQETILNAGGIVSLYEDHGRNLFHHLANSRDGHLPEASSSSAAVNCFNLGKEVQELDW